METTALALSPRDHMREMVVEAKRRLSELNEIATSAMKTSGQFKWRDQEADTPSKTIDIFKTTNIKFLMSILGYIKLQLDMYQTAAKEIGLKTIPAFTWLGYDYDAWKADITLRVRILTQKEEKDRLQEVVDTMSKYMTEEDRMRNDLERIAGLMGVELPKSE